MANENALPEKSSPASWLESSKDYIEDLQKEMRLVTWPSRKQVIATTTVVVASVFLFAAYFAVIDQLFGRLITYIFKATAK